MNADMRLEHDWFPAPLPDNVVLGAGSWVYSSYAFRHFRSRQPVAVRIGCDTGIYHGTFFDVGPDGEVAIGRYCALVGAIISCNSRIVIGDYSLLAHEVVLADSSAAIPYDRPAVGSIARIKRGDAPATVTIGDNVWIGARAIILAGADIGAGSIVGAGAVVDFPVPPGSMVVGNPGRIVQRSPRSATS